MAHKLDFSKGKAGFISYEAPAWHGLGKVFDRAITTADALEEAGLNFEVQKLPNVHILPVQNFNPAAPEFQELISDNSFFTYRTDTNKVLGDKLGADYTVWQNREALNFVDEILQKGECTIETAGSLDEGRSIFVTLKVNQSIVINGQDKITQYVLIATSHDGTKAITVMFTNVRVVCANTLAAALGQAQGQIKIRHSRQANDRVKDALKVMNLIHQNTAENAENYEFMSASIIEPTQFFNYVGNVVFGQDEIKALFEGTKVEISKQKQNQVEDIMKFARFGKGQDMALNGIAAPNLFWAYNAVTGYATRKSYANANERAKSMMFGTAANMIQNAGTLALSPANIQPLKKSAISNLSMN